MIFSLLGLAIMLVLIGVGIVLGVFAVVLTLILVAAGVVSSSVMIGVWRGRVQTGILALALQGGILAGIPAGMMCAWLATKVSEKVDGSLVIVLAVGGFAGALGGMVVALMFAFIASAARGWR